MIGWKNKVLRYVLLFLAGYCVYLAVEVTFRGYSYRLMGVTGGVVLVILGFLSGHGMWKLQLPLQMLAGAAVITALELTVGIFSLEILGIRMWDYEEEWMSMCRDLICPKYSLYWFLLSGIAVFFTGAVDYYVLGSSQRPVYRIFRWTISFPKLRRLYWEQMTENNEE